MQVSNPAKPRLRVLATSKSRLAKPEPNPEASEAMSRPPKGERTRESILKVAVNLASVEGLEGVTIGRLADELSMSKSGLFAHFGSKTDLQLATVDAAREIFIDNVVLPALSQPEGMPRLWALCDDWLGHIEHHVFAGGCFFTAASFEFDSRPGPVRNRIVTVMKEWLCALTKAVEGAKKMGHLKASVDPERLAFEINSSAMGAHWAYQLLDDKKALSTARSTILTRIRELSTSKCPVIRTKR